MKAAKGISVETREHKPGDSSKEDFGFGKGLENAQFMFSFDSEILYNVLRFWLVHKENNFVLNFFCFILKANFFEVP